MVLLDASVGRGNSRTAEPAYVVLVKSVVQPGLLELAGRCRLHRYVLQHGNYPLVATGGGSFAFKEPTDSIIEEVLQADHGHASEEGTKPMREGYCA